MKAIILAAGRGSRLKEMTIDRPKPMIEVGGVSILQNTFDNLIAYGIQEVIVVVGYLADKIENRFGNNYNNLKITYCHNKIWETTNNIYSLHLALKNIFNESFLLIEGDEFFSHDIIDINKLHNQKNYWVAKKTKDITGCTLFTKTNSQKINKIEIIRDIQILNAIKKDTYKSCGILKINAKTKNIIQDKLRKYIGNPANCNIYFDLFLAKNIHLLNIQILPIKNNQWYEIDDHDDLKIAEQLFTKQS